MKPVIGLIGGIGSGKSLVAELFRQRGARVIAADPLGHEALRQPEIRAQAVQRWGTAILDERGEIDRQRVADLVFADANERRALEALVFPWIERRLREEIAAAQADPHVRLIVLDAAIMLETGWNKVCDRLIFLDTPRPLRYRRLAEQRGWSAEQVAARENAQMSLEEKASRADAVVKNTGSPEELATQVEHLLRRWDLLPYVAEAAKPPGNKN